ncbi:MAG: T9SS type A sorting domain-containing protein [Candidatus Zixiibacteriota bacterium]|nr:MAG: T9SS type A sorting domain-containing protein [candidate division Zixibacteria bacterium]
MRRAPGIFTALLLVSTIAPAAPPEKGIDVPLSAETLIRDNASFIDANQILMFVTNHGIFGRDLVKLISTNYGCGTWWPFSGDTADYIGVEGGVNDHTVQYSAGLWMGGYVAGELRVTITNGSMDEYWPGPMESETFILDADTDPQYHVYKLYSDSLEGNPNADYTDWPESQGAPVDGEGKPAMMGDRMLWSVFNDANPDRHTVTGGKCTPLGIEVQQTVWAFDRADKDSANTVFIRYKIYNKGGDDITDFRLSIFADMEIGDFLDDFIGCDTLDDIFYAYNGLPSDNYYAPLTTPAAGYRILKGPVVPASGETAYFDGHLIPDHKNLGLTSLKRHGMAVPPTDSLEAYNYMSGLEADGATLETGTLYDVPGDPVPPSSGFIDYDAGDRVMVGSAGPFDFNAGDSQYVLLAFASVSGTSNLNSITELRSILNSYTDFPVGIEDEPPAAQLPQGYLLSQNYPNPFNPSTTIRFTLPRRSDVKIDIFNILGQRIVTILDEARPAGQHSVVWDGTDENNRPVSTGLYFYRIKAGDYTDSKKMLMLK